MLVLQPSNAIIRGTRPTVNQAVRSGRRRGRRLNGYKDGRGRWRSCRGKRGGRYSRYGYQCRHGGAARCGARRERADSGRSGERSAGRRRRGRSGRAGGRPCGRRVGSAGLTSRRRPLQNLGRANGCVDGGPCRWELLSDHGWRLAWNGCWEGGRRRLTGRAPFRGQGLPGPRDPVACAHRRVTLAGCRRNGWMRGGRGGHPGGEGRMASLVRVVHRC